MSLRILDECKRLIETIGWLLRIAAVKACNNDTSNKRWR